MRLLRSHPRRNGHHGIPQPHRFLRRQFKGDIDGAPFRGVVGDDLGLFVIDEEADLTVGPLEAGGVPLRVLDRVLDGRVGAVHRAE